MSCKTYQQSEIVIKCKTVETYKIETLFTIPESSELLLDLIQVPHIASDPLNLRILSDFLFYLLDRFVTLLFFAVDHDYTGSILYESFGDLESASPIS